MTSLICIVALLLITANVCYASGSEDKESRWQTRFAGLKAGYGVSFNDDDGQVQMIGVFPYIRWGMYHWPVGEDRTFELSFAVEATLVRFVKPYGDVGAGFLRSFGERCIYWGGPRTCN